MCFKTHSRNPPSSCSAIPSSRLSIYIPTHDHHKIYVYWYQTTGALFMIAATFTSLWVLSSNPIRNQVCDTGKLASSTTNRINLIKAPNITCEFLPISYINSCCYGHYFLFITSIATGTMGASIVIPAAISI